MRLLISVAGAEDAAAALAGGADIIDAKDPSRGALGPVDLARFLEIQAVVAGQRPVTAALGDTIDDETIVTAERFAQAGAAFVKVGLHDLHGAHAAVAIARMVIAVGTARPSCGVIVCAYADVEGVPPDDFLERAAHAGAAGVLLDTVDKSGARLPDLASPTTLVRWVTAAHGAGLTVALAGRLIADDLPLVHWTSADIAGIRGAACDGGRTGRVTSEKVRRLRALCTEAPVDPPTRSWSTPLLVPQS
jgi:(5-formylfuran-3-yl)methyl phosphate synthase